ncbi:hypothetical protein KEM48_004592 [Puccinia striiformis f. sp. tritici PST-130]|nr:hypothetical protein KEM48_004592 [Puccinia striiformis f. sp. tritici PST-130]
MSESAFKNHAEEIQRKIQKSQLDLVWSDSKWTILFLTIRSTSGSHDPPRIMSYSTVLAPSTTSSEIIDTFKWSPISFEFVHQHALAVMVQAVLGSLLDGRSEKNINNFLKAEIEKVKMSSQYKTSEMNAILKQIPKTLQTSAGKLGLNSAVISMVCCPDCFALYPLPQNPKADSEPESVSKVALASQPISEAKSTPALGAESAPASQPQPAKCPAPTSDTTRTSNLRSLQIQQMSKIARLYFTHQARRT